MVRAGFAGRAPPFIGSELARSTAASRGFSTCDRSPRSAERGDAGGRLVDSFLEASDLARRARTCRVWLYPPRTTCRAARLSAVLLDLRAGRFRGESMLRTRVPRLRRWPPYELRAYVNQYICKFFWAFFGVSAPRNRKRRFGADDRRAPVQSPGSGSAFRDASSAFFYRLFTSLFNVYVTCHLRIVAV